MESKLLLQTDTFNKLDKASKNFKKSPKSRLTEIYVQVRLDRLESLWLKFMSTHEELMEKFGKDLNDTIYMKEDLYEQAENIYLDYKCELKTIFEVNVSAKDHVDSCKKSDAASYQSKIDLPKIVIPKFSGQYAEWVTFRDLFKSLVHKNEKLCNVQRMHYLKCSLTGEAEQLLRQIPISDANYERCWALLTSRYDNKRYISYHILKRLLSQRNIPVESASSLKQLLDTTNDCLSGLKNINIDIQNWDIIIIHILSLKLDSESRKQWEFQITRDNETDQLPTFNQFQEFITNRYRALEFLDTKSSVTRFHNNKNYDNVNINSLHVSKNICPLCSDESHKLTNCKNFAQEPTDRRRDFVMSKGLCFNCLGNNHRAEFCKSITKCKLCHRRHHTLLHPKHSSTRETTCSSTMVSQNTDSLKNKIELVQSGGTADQSVNSTSVVTCFSTGKIFKQVLLATALVKAESKNGYHHTVRALLDQGSQANFITETTVQDLKLKKMPLRSKICGVGGDQEVLSKAIVNIKLVSRVNPQFSLTLKAHILNSITTFLPVKKVEIVEWPELREMELADPKYHQPSKIDMLLGAEAYSQILKEGLVRSPNSSLIAQSTNLGWIISGVVGPSEEQSESILTLHCQAPDEEDLLKKFWELEKDNNLTEDQKWTKEEKQCEEIYLSSTKRDESNRYVVRLPFKEDPNFIGSNSQVIAERRLRALENRFKKDEELKKKYKEVIDEYVQLGHAVEVSKSNAKVENAIYLPHQAVIRNDKDTTKVRVVFDASAKYQNGRSLNDYLLVGPTIQPDLRHLVMRWRLFPICISADIVKMYRQIIINRKDTKFQRFLWRENSETEIKHFELLRVTFGTASAPFLAVRTLKQLGEDYAEEYPLAADRVNKEFYMDDLMSGCDKIEDGIAIYTEMTNLLKKGGFEIRKWTSNNDTLLNLINDKEKEMDMEEGINIKMDKIIKILGLTWERSADNFRYSVSLPELEPPVTKRKIIGDISRLFDPLGWITPCIILAKVIIQKLWLLGIDWDEEVPQDILNDWCTYRRSLVMLKQVTVPRWMGTSADDVQRELHGFCDASKMAYAAVVYLRVIDSKGNIRISLVAAKSKVAPIKQVSIPRLELCGAVLLKRLLLEVAQILNINKINLHAWTDSTIVLAWLHGLPNKWKVFVGNRVSEIITALEPWQWSHVSSKQNPADCASRGILPAELKTNALWFHGPAFLKQLTITYEKLHNLDTNLEAIKIHHVVNLPDIWDRFSSLTKLGRVLAYCRRWMIVKSFKGKYKNYLQAEEISKAIENCVKVCQEKNFGEIITAIKNKKEVKLKGALKSLNPFLDQDNILRVGGRLEKSDLEETKKHPIILPKESTLTNLIIADAHLRTLHGGIQLTVNYLYNKFWIIGAKQLVKSHIRKCVTCVKNKGLTFNPLMGQLPAVRVTPSRPFIRSGVDFAGPIQIRTSKGRGHKSTKGYVCLFVCMCTRAVHVEAVSDLTTNGFLQAFKRFVARRGHCQELWSDNGTNFVGASVELRKLFCEEKSGIVSEIADSLATNGTTWRFIPPQAPNFGGIWEAGVKSVKYHLKRVIGCSTLTFEELATVLCQVEACLNSRPLSRLENEHEFPTVLTPGNFLVGEPLVTPPDHNYQTSNLSSLKRWQYTQRMLQSFWSRWSQEYLRQFFHRYRWNTQNPTPNVGDIVLIKEEGLPPCRWLYGIVKFIHPGRDGITRVVTVQTKGSVIKRPVSKLCLLPVTN